MVTPIAVITAVTDGCGRRQRRTITGACCPTVVGQGCCNFCQQPGSFHRKRHGHWLFSPGIKPAMVKQGIQSLTSQGEIGIMKKHLITAAALSLLVACSSSQKKEEQYVKECVFADGSKEEAPLWVCGAPVEGIELSAVGYADKSAAGPNFMKQMAATAARVELAQMMKVQVQNMVKQYAEVTGSADSETVDKVNSATTKQITNESLSGTRIYRQIQTPSGGMVVLVGIDAETAAKIAEQALKTSMNNERALWQKFQSEKSFDELAAEIAKTRE
jgi:hypothetical protein